MSFSKLCLNFELCIHFTFKEINWKKNNPSNWKQVEVNEPNQYDIYPHKMEIFQVTFEYSACTSIVGCSKDKTPVKSETLFRTFIISNTIMVL